MKTSILFENGHFIEARSFGAQATSIGKLKLIRDFCGTQEILSSPENWGKFLLFSFPEIGMVGVNDDDYESDGFAKGMIVRRYNDFLSNFRAQKTLSQFLHDHSIMGICDIETRQLVRNLPHDSTMSMIASNIIHDKNELEKILRENTNQCQALDLTTKNSYVHEQGSWDYQTMSYSKPDLQKDIIVYDFGVTKSLLHEISSLGVRSHVVPHNYDTNKVVQSFRSNEIQGVFISNSPDELDCFEGIDGFKSIVEAGVPILAGDFALNMLKKIGLNVDGDRSRLFFANNEQDFSNTLKDFREIL